MREFYVYIVASKSRRIYIGVTNDIARRVDQHRRGESEFTARYRMNRLVYVEIYPTALEAIGREKWMKKRPRRDKLAMVEKDNPEWRDLAAGWFEAGLVLDERRTADPRPLRGRG
jgi:putative endonuclease